MWWGHLAPALTWEVREDQGDAESLLNRKGSQTDLREFGGHRPYL